MQKKKKSSGDHSEIVSVSNNENLKEEGRKNSSKGQKEKAGGTGQTLEHCRMLKAGHGHLQQVSTAARDEEGNFDVSVISRI